MQRPSENQLENCLALDGRTRWGGWTWSWESKLQGSWVTGHSQGDKSQMRGFWQELESSSGSKWRSALQKKRAGFVWNQKNDWVLSIPGTDRSKYRLPNSRNEERTKPNPLPGCVLRLWLLCLRYLEFQVWGGVWQPEWPVPGAVLSSGSRMSALPFALCIWQCVTDFASKSHTLCSWPTHDRLLDLRHPFCSLLPVPGHP